MIFISYSHADKHLVDPIAHRLRGILGNDKIFYDGWSIQPGDSIVEKMNSALEQCHFFLLFVSVHSMQSGMVRQEWQSALMRLAGGGTRVIPIRLDDCAIPSVLTQYLYVDFFTDGPDVATRQLLDVLGGQQFSEPVPARIPNLAAMVTVCGTSTIVECRAEHYLEPSSSYLLLVDHAESELAVEYRSGVLSTTAFVNGVSLSNGSTHNAVRISVERATSPGFPVVVALTPTSCANVRLAGVMHERRSNEWVAIPMLRHSE